MRFIFVHKAVSYLMVLTSSLALITSGELPPLINLIVLLAIAASWFWEPPAIDVPRYEMAWNVLTLALLAKTVLELVAGGAMLISGIEFIEFLLVNKLFNRLRSRDYLQLYLLSFLQVVAATTLSSGISFGVLFLLYVIFTTWTLILFHLKREMEDNYLLKYGNSLEGRPVQVQRVLNSRKLVGWRFLATTSAASMLIFLGSSLVFFLFPRVGFGLFFRRDRGALAMTGFSDRMELGHFGVIKRDPTVVMRVRLPHPEDRRRLSPYWRGISLDHYDGKAWSNSLPGRDPAPRGIKGIYLIGRPPARPEAAVAQEIYLEPMETRVLFGLTRLYAIQLDEAPVIVDDDRQVMVTASGDTYYDQGDRVAFRYTAWSDPMPQPNPLANLDLRAYQSQLERDPVEQGDQRPYLQLPATLEPEIGQLARQIAGDARTVGQIVDRIERHLRGTYTYTLDLERDPRYSPLYDFLFVQRAGHCEYFSTAMVVLLRTLGVAARPVNGFLGGEWNQYGHYLAVTQGDAHAWVEVALPGHRWLTRDPTPSASAPRSPPTYLTHLTQYIDALRLRWYKYIIEWNLQKQLGALQSLSRGMRATLGGRGSRWLLGRSKPGEGHGTARWIGALLLVSIALAAVWLRRKGVSAGGLGARPSPDARAAANLYAQLIDVYGRRGFGRQPATTAREFLAMLRRREAPELPLAEEVVALYERARFGGEALNREATRALARRIHTVTIR